MSGLVDAAATAAVAAALLLAVGVLTRTHDIRAALSVFLDLLLVAGLLRLSATGTWQAIGSAAVVVVVRKLAAYGIRTGRQAREQERPAEGARALT